MQFVTSLQTMYFFWLCVVMCIDLKKCIFILERRWQLIILLIYICFALCECFHVNCPLKKLSANGYSWRICRAILISPPVIVCNLSNSYFDSTCGSNLKIWNALRVFNVNISQLTQYVSNNKIYDGLKSFIYFAFYETFF